MTSAALTPAASAIERRPTPKPRSPNRSIAAPRIRAAAVRSSTERMFKILNTRSARRQGDTPSQIQLEFPKWLEFPKGLGTEGGLGSVANGGQQAVAERHQSRRELLILGD